MDSAHDDIKRFDFLKNLAPCFPVCGDNVEVLQSPSDFYDCLVNGVTSAKQRIVLSALYLGTDHFERHLIDSIQKTVTKRESENISMNINILFDYVRGSRGEVNTKTMLLPLVQQCSTSTQEAKTSLSVFLYHTPFLRGALKSNLPARFNEIIGLNHIKAYVFDDSLLISGANLSENYFEQRQDRYILFKNCPALCNYFHCLIQAVGSFSLQLEANGDVKLSNECPHHPVTGDIQQFIKFANSRLSNLICSFSSNPAKGNPPFLEERYADEHKGLSLQRLKPPSVLTKEYDYVGQCDPYEDHADTFVYPTIQFGFADIRQDELVTNNILDSFSSGTYVCFTSGYFNITKGYSSKILKTFADFDILTASPEANGFLGARGFAGKIPAVYCHLTRQFFRQILEHGKAGNIKVWEYVRPDWTYHAKGFWFYGKHQNLPSMTMVGSSNFGVRSVDRDLEAQMTVVTKNTNLMRQLHQERCALMKWSKPVTKDTFLQSRYFVPRWVSFVTGLIKHYF